MNHAWRFPRELGGTIRCSRSIGWPSGRPGVHDAASPGRDQSHVHESGGDPGGHPPGQVFRGSHSWSQRPGSLTSRRVSASPPRRRVPLAVAGGPRSVPSSQDATILRSRSSRDSSGRIRTSRMPNACWPPRGRDPNAVLPSGDAGCRRCRASGRSTGTWAAAPRPQEEPRQAQRSPADGPGGRKESSEARSARGGGAERCRMRESWWSWVPAS